MKGVVALQKLLGSRGPRAALKAGPLGRKQLRYRASF